MSRVTFTIEEQAKYVKAFEELGGYSQAARALHVSTSRIKKAVRRSRGLCDCGNELIDGRLTCHICQKRAKRTKRRNYHSRKEAGLCVRCGQPRKDSRSTVYCEQCRISEREAANQRRAKRKYLGLCLQCGEPLDSRDPAYCAKHAPKVRLRAFKARNRVNFNGMREQILERDNHVCIICGGTAIRLEIHHKKKDGGNAPENLDTLCAKCHHAITYLYNSPDPYKIWDYFLTNPEQ